METQLDLANRRRKEEICELIFKRNYKSNLAKYANVLFASKAKPLIESDDENDEESEEKS